MSDDQDPAGIELHHFMFGFDGFYRRTQEERTVALTDGVVVFDANALLDLYRLSPTSRDELLNVIGAVAERAFVPHQVALEFHRRRVSVVASRMKEFEDHLDRLGALRDELVGLVRQVARRAHGREADSGALQETLVSALDEANRFVEEVVRGYDLRPDELAASPPDAIATRLHTLLGPRVAGPPSESDLTIDKAEARRRIEAGIPPGFADRKKNGDDALGDYLWWAEGSLHELVTSDLACPRGGPGRMLLCRSHTRRSSATTS